MNILVTGGAGFIGSNISEAYIKLGHKVIIIDDLYSGRKENVPENAIFFEMDIRDTKLKDVFKKYKIEFVNHQAARGDVRGSVERPKEYADVNITGGINLLECSVQNNVSGFIYSSTGGCVYGEAKYFPTDESHPMQPRDPYGASKASFELYVQTYHQLYGLPYTIFRYPNVYGPKQNPFGEAGVVSIFSKRIIADNDIIINGDGTQERDYVFVDDVVRANLLATEKKSNCVYNLGSGVGTDVNTIFHKLKAVSRYEKDPIHVPPKIGEVQKSVLSSDKIFQYLTWKASVALDEGLKITFDYISVHEK